MCVRNVFVLVLFCCVNCLPRRDTHSSIGIFDTLDNSNVDIHGMHSQSVDDPKTQTTNPTVMYAGLPQILQVVPLSLEHSDELQFNVSWIPYKGREVKQYSLEVTSISNTSYCTKPMCYEFNIPGTVTWFLIPDSFSSIVGTSCAPRPGCAYNVTLKPEPWDGITTAVQKVELEECVAGVCSCDHSPRLPVPKVFAETYFREGKLFANINWTLPTPSFPQRLPKLKKKSYIVSIGRKKYVTFSNIFTLNLTADGAVAEGETKRLSNVLLSKPSRKNGGPEKLIARVSLMDERGCNGSTGYYIFDLYPVEPSIRECSFGAYAILVGLIGAWIMGAVIVLSALVVKRVLKSFRPAPVSASLEPLRRRRVALRSSRCSYVQPSCTGENEVYTECKQTCPPEICFSISAFFDCYDEPPCTKGCVCKPGYLRKQTDSPCVPTCKCPQRVNAPECIEEALKGNR